MYQLCTKPKIAICQHIDIMHIMHTNISRQTAKIVLKKALYFNMLV
jgi:hypothetical protein